MKTIRSQEQVVPHFNSSVLTIGNFDGVHLGHQKLMHELLTQSANYKTQSVVCTFRPHPREILRPDVPYYRLFDYRDQAEKLAELGVDFLIEEKFSKDFSLISAVEFLQQYIVKIYKPLHIVVGYDFSFGHSRQGNIESLRQFCKDNQMGLSVVDAYLMNQKIVSTTLIRESLEKGDLKTAFNCLGRSYYLRGPVRHGYKRGRLLGVPTANISPEVDFVPRRGVYFTWAYLGQEKIPSITNIGVNPTFENSDSYTKVETHFFNFDRDIYGEQVKVELCHFHRDEKKFPSFDDLKKQIHEDLAQARQYFGLK